MSLSVSNISKFYSGQQALKNISFEVGPGEIVGFLGPNGAGKSTLLKILSTYLPPSDGVAQVHGFNIEKDVINVRRSVGYLPEHNPLYTSMYVREYLAYNARMYQANSDRIALVLEQTGLIPQAHKKIHQLSKGYRQRVGLAAALLHNPQVLLLDEPTTGLDPMQLREIRALIKEIGRSKTILLSTHILQEVEALCDRVLMIHDGVIVADEKIETLLEQQKQCIIVEFDYRIEEAFFEKLSDLEQVVNTQGFVYEMTFKTKIDMRPKVFDFAHEHGLKALQIRRKNQNLEQLFLDRTQMAQGNTNVPL